MFRFHKHNITLWSIMHIWSQNLILMRLQEMISFVCTIRTSLHLFRRGRPFWWPSLRRRSSTPDFPPDRSQWQWHAWSRPMAGPRPCDPAYPARSSGCLVSEPAATTVPRLWNWIDYYVRWNDRMSHFHRTGIACIDKTQGAQWVTFLSPVG